MNIHLSDLQEAVNSKFQNESERPVTFHLTNDNWILSYLGNVAYFFNYEKLQEVLDTNGFDHYYKEETQELINDLLSKHIINQLKPGIPKTYPEIKTLLSDPNKN